MVTLFRNVLLYTNSINLPNCVRNAAAGRQITGLSRSPRAVTVIFKPLDRFHFKTTSAPKVFPARSRLMVINNHTRQVLPEMTRQLEQTLQLRLFS